jgi:hypothetical protein
MGKSDHMFSPLGQQNAATEIDDSESPKMKSKASADHAGGKPDLSFKSRSVS